MERMATQHKWRRTMVALSKYEDAAKAFLKAHPIGTVITSDRMLDWAGDHANGLAADLLIPDPNKRLGSIRRHLNDGGASRSFAESNRFYLAVTDAKRKTLLVQSLFEHVSEQADEAVGKAVVGALTPINRSLKASEDVKKEELSEEDQAELEQQMQELIETAVPFRKVCSERVIAHWVGKLITKGFTAEQAKHMIDSAPMMIRAHRLLKLTR
jgi:hypothetical protein